MDGKIADVGMSVEEKSGVRVVAGHGLNLYPGLINAATNVGLSGIEALREQRLLGAALDVFEKEPVPDDEPILKLDNVVVTPHTACWTDECFRKMGDSAIDSILTVLKGEVPRYVVNHEVLQKPSLCARLNANRERWQKLSQEAGS